MLGVPPFQSKRIRRMDQGDSQQHSSLPLAREHAELRMQYGCSIGEVQGSQDNHPSATIDCFARTDKQEVAINRNYHLQWWDHDRPTNNFVSWSSSLLFALQMICYRANHSKDAPLKYKDIQLCIIDTTKLSKDAFIRDLDLTRAFAPFDSSDNNNLTKFHDLRSGPTWYFGEYLSQGALNVENCIQLVSAKAIMDAGLQVLRPDLMLFKHAPPAKLASEVVERRKVFDQIAGLPLVERAVEDVVAITKLFGDDYKLPIAAYFSALLPREEEDDGLVNLLVALNRTEEEEAACSLAQTNIVAPATMPEMMEFRKLTTLFHSNYRRSNIKEFEKAVASALDFRKKAQLCTRMLGSMPNSAPKFKLEVIRAGLEEVATLTNEMLTQVRVRIDEHGR